MCAEHPIETRMTRKDCKKMNLSMAKQLLQQLLCQGLGTCTDMVKAAASSLLFLILVCYCSLLQQLRAAGSPDAAAASARHLLEAAAADPGAGAMGAAAEAVAGRLPKYPHPCLWLHPAGSGHCASLQQVLAPRPLSTTIAVAWSPLLAQL